MTNIPNYIETKSLNSFLVKNNSFLVNNYYGKLERIDKTLSFHVAYQCAFQDPDGGIYTTYRYKSYESFENFYEIIKNEIPENMRWFEIMKADNPVIECYDLDAKLDDNKERNLSMFKLYQEIGEDAMIDAFKHHRKQFIEMYYPTYDVKETFAISTACTNNKFSLHIAVRNGFYFQDTANLKIMMTEFDEYLKHNHFVLDLSIYSKNRCMRMLGNTKYGQKRFLKKHRYSSHLNDNEFLFSYVKPDDEIFHIKPKEKKSIILKEKEKSYDTSKDYEKMTQLLNLINSDCDQSKWSTIGQVIFNITNGSDDGLEQFIEWSQKDAYIEFNKNDCIKTWNSYKENDNYGLGILVNRAKEDSPEEYAEISKKNDSSRPDIVFVDDKPLKPADTHEDIAIYIISQFQKDKNVYYSAKKNRIYVYNENSKLFEEKQFDVIMNFISFYMTPIINKYGEYLLSQINSCSKDNEKALQEKIKQKYKLLRDVKCAGYQKNVLTCIKTRIKDDDEFIENTFNKIKHLLAIADNKVINFKTLEVEERCKEHYFTYTTDNIFKADRPNRKWVYNYVSQILKTDNPEFVQCFLTHLGYCMTGETCIKKFPIWTGDGDNGKSACFNVIKKIFGKFAIVGNEKVFLKQKSNSVHSDEYLPLIGKRFSYLQEIDANSLFNEKLIKSITGGDGDISLRACGGTTVEVILDCKLLCVCNGDDIPNFIDKQGFTNRLMVIPFKNKFERDTKKLIEIDSMKDDIFTELCFYVKEFFYDNNMDIKFSIEIESATNEVKDNKDSIKQFMDEKIQITTDEKDRIKKDSIFNSYSFYCKNSDFKDCAIGKVAFYRTLREKYKLEIHRDREFKFVKFIQDDDLLTIDNGLPPL